MKLILLLVEHILLELWAVARLLDYRGHKHPEVQLLLDFWSVGEHRLEIDPSLRVVTP